MDVFDDRGNWNQDFLDDPVYRHINQELQNSMRILMNKGYSIRNISHALVSDVIASEMGLHVIGARK